MRYSTGGKAFSHSQAMLVVILSSVSSMPVWAANAELTLYTPDLPSVVIPAVQLRLTQPHVVQWLSKPGMVPGPPTFYILGWRDVWLFNIA